MKTHYSQRSSCGFITVWHTPTCTAAMLVTCPVMPWGIEELDLFRHMSPFMHLRACSSLSLYVYFAVFMDLSDLWEWDCTVNQNILKWQWEPFKIISFVNYVTSLLRVGPVLDQCFSFLHWLCQVSTFSFLLVVI